MMLKGKREEEVLAALYRNFNNWVYTSGSKWFPHNPFTDRRLGTPALPKRLTSRCTNTSTFPTSYPRHQRKKQPWKCWGDEGWAGTSLDPNRACKEKTHRWFPIAVPGSGLSCIGRNANYQTDFQMDPSNSYRQQARSPSPTITLHYQAHYNHTSLKHLQGRGLRHLTGPACPNIDHPVCEEILPDI